MPRRSTARRDAPPPRAWLSAVALLGAGLAVAGVLLACRPRPHGPVGAWTGDELGVVCIWSIAIACSAWLALTTLLCLAATARGRVRLARRLAALAPPLARRALETALVGAWAIVPAPAFAATHHAPITVHADAAGRLTSVPPASPATEVPVVRAPGPAPTPPSSTTTPPPAVAPTTTTPPPVAPSPSAPPAPAPATGSSAHLVRPGDNLWRIATAEVARATGVDRPGDAAVAHYWRRLIAANRTTLRSHDPSLIFPGELVTLPALGGPSPG